jgi:hypothetical protein
LVKDHEAVEGRRGDGEPPGDAQGKPVPNLAEVGILLAHGVRHLATDAIVFQDQVRARRPDGCAGFPRDDLLHVVEVFFQQGVGPPGHGLQALDHAGAVEEGPHGLGLDVGQAEAGPAAEFLLDVGDDFEQLGVGLEQQLEVVVFDLEAAHQLIARRALLAFEKREHAQLHTPPSAVRPCARAE